MKVIKFTSIPAIERKPWAITNKHGEVFYVEEAELMRLISAGFRVPYEIKVPESGMYGEKLADGNYTGVLGLVHRSEVDLALGHMGITKERLHDFNVCYPHAVTDVTFMGDKLEPLSHKEAIFYPFSYQVWILMMLFIIIMTLLFCLLTNKKQGFLNMLVIVLGSMLEKSIDIKISTPSYRFLLFTWLTGVFVLTNSYKGALLSFLTLPTMVGIRDISDLSKAAMENSVKCFSYKGNLASQILKDSNIDSWKPIADCLIRSQIKGDEHFDNAKGRKVFVTGRKFCLPYASKYFVSKDSFFDEMSYIYYSKHFCCPDYLNKLILRFYETGLLQKYRRDEAFYTELYVRVNYPESKQLEPIKKISFSYISGAFIILLSGWVLGFFVFLIEIVGHKQF